MSRRDWVRIGVGAGLLTAVLALAAGAAPRAQQRGGGPADHPQVTVFGQVYSPASILARNMGTAEDQETPFPPHKIVGNIYYVGTKTLSSFLVVTPAGNILIDSTYERNVPGIR
jgi:metallo-beta-lactamase class B